MVGLGSVYTSILLHSVVSSTAQKVIQLGTSVSLWCIQDYHYLPYVTKVTISYYHYQSTFLLKEMQEFKIWTSHPRRFETTCELHKISGRYYHYHQMSSCFFNNPNACPSNKLLGVALDGVPIYGPCDKDGNELTQASGELDACNGHTTTIG